MTIKSVSRRGFLQQATAAGSTVLFAGKARALTHASANGTEADTSHALNPPTEKAPRRVQPFSMQDVRLLPSFWKDTMELNRGFLYSIPNDRLLHNFRITAGLPSTAAPLGGWEAPDCELRGHYVGHYLSACALLHASTGDEAIRGKADDLVAGMALCQEKSGYLGAYAATYYDRLRQNQRVWAPFYTYHKILAGLIDMYQHTGNKQALAMAKRMADWAVAWNAPIPEDQFQKILLEEQGGMNEALFNLYGITGETKYRNLAIRFEHHMILGPLANNEDILAGNHANTNIPKIIGAARGYELTGDPRYRAISKNFYRMVADHHTYCTGGTSDDEYWFAPDAVSTRLGPKAQECCCVYNMMKLTRHLYGQDPDPALFDYYERVLLNVRYGTQDRMGMLMYYVSLTPGLYKTFGTPYNSFWCCTGTGSEEYAKLNDSIYFHDADAVYVNLFIPSVLDWSQRGLTLKLTTSFPEEETVRFSFLRSPEQATTLKLRVPNYAVGATVKVNGELRNQVAAPSSYVTLSEPWKTGDVVELTLPMKVHIHKAPDNPEVQAAMYGPLVLATLLGTDGPPASMIHGVQGPDLQGHAYPLPEISAPGVWVSRIDDNGHHSLRFQTIGTEITHTLIPLNQVMDQRYTVYVRNKTKA
jgi:DUF1680 family protein